MRREWQDEERRDERRYSGILETLCIIPTLWEFFLACLARDPTREMSLGKVIA